MEIYRVAFFGHRDMSEAVRLGQRLERLAKELIRKKEFIEFYVGRNGDFDISAAAAIKTAQNALGKETSALILVLPYPVKDLEYYEAYYDEIILPVASETHFKAAITKRNEWMAENCDLAVGYVERESGGAFRAMNYVKKLGVETLYFKNVPNEEEE